MFPREPAAAYSVVVIIASLTTCVSLLGLAIRLDQGRLLLCVYRRG